MKALTTPSYLVATDLDGTLLDHHNYSWEAALPSIQQLKALGTPIIVNTSKTFFEVVDLQHELALNDPFIVENGSAIYVPKDHTLLTEVGDQNNFNDFDTHYARCILGETKENIVTALHALREQNGWKFEGYSDWQCKDVMRHTGLDSESAERSMQRQFSEPIVWRDTDDAYRNFAQHIARSNLRLIRGGRFIHILGNSDKGSALNTLKIRLEAHSQQHFTVIALGDTHNDLDMLNQADIPVFVKSPAHEFPAHACIYPPIYTEGFGPEGWHEAISIILKKSGVDHG